MNLICPALLPANFVPARLMNNAVAGGKNVSPPILWGGIPPGTKSFALCITDLDAQGGVLWFVANIPAELRGLDEDASGVRDRLPAGCLEFRNVYGDLRYGGPIVRPGDEPHRIGFQLWALSVPTLEAGPFTPHPDRLSSIGPFIIETATLEAIATRTV